MGHLGGCGRNGIRYFAGLSATIVMSFGNAQAVPINVPGLLGVTYDFWSCPGFVDGARLSPYATTGCRCS